MITTNCYGSGTPKTKLVPAFSLDMVRLGPAKSIQRHLDPFGAALWDLEQYPAARILIYEVKKPLPQTVMALVHPKPNLCQLFHLIWSE